MATEQGHTKSSANMHSACQRTQPYAAAGQVINTEECCKKEEQAETEQYDKNCQPALSVPQRLGPLDLPYYTTTAPQDTPDSP
jgi:hypothetical protein